MLILFFYIINMTARPKNTGIDQNEVRSPPFVFKTKMGTKSLDLVPIPFAGNRSCKECQVTVIMAGSSCADFAAREERNPCDRGCQAYLVSGVTSISLPEESGLTIFIQGSECLRSLVKVTFMHSASGPTFKRTSCDLLRGT